MRGKIGFISTRFCGLDGVSLETKKWAKILEDEGFECHYLAGELDRPEEKSFMVEEAHFKHPDIEDIYNECFGTDTRKSSITRKIHEIKKKLKSEILDFVNKFEIDLLIAENSLTIPLNIPLGIAITEFISETKMPTIAHHHDFYWERIRFSVNAVNDYLRMAFPPNLPNIKHVVINSEAQEQLALRSGISSIIVPNILDFENPPLVDAQHTQDFRKSICLKPDDIMILQPTRIVRRKGIEQAIELVKELRDPRYKLVISHEAGDEGFEYADWLKEYAFEHHVDLRMVTTKIADPWINNRKDQTQYSLWDIYPYADFITYPSLYEGFGNAFLGAIYFKKPLLINRYPIFVRDIEPKGFDLVVMDGFLTKKTVREVREILESRERKEKMVNLNYEVASSHYSYAVFQNQFGAIMNNLTGESKVPQRNNFAFSGIDAPAWQGVRRANSKLFN